MKKISLIILLLLLSSFAYANPIIKTYGQTKDYTVDYINNYDLKGLKYILVYPDSYSNYWWGQYYPNQIILYSSKEYVFAHELAHHYNYLETKNYQQHTDNFYKCLEEINEK